MAGSLVLSGQSVVSLSDKLTELDELQTKAEQSAKEEKSRKQREDERKNGRKRAHSTVKNIRTGTADKRNGKQDTRPKRQPKPADKRSGKKDTRPKRQPKPDVGSSDVDIRSGGSDSGNRTNDGATRLGTFEATFYTAYCSTGCTGVTATGVDVSNTIYHEGLRVIAVDPAVIPLGTRVKVTLADGSSFVASASDTGGAIKGRRIDVLVASKSEARRKGRQKAELQIIE